MYDMVGKYRMNVELDYEDYQLIKAHALRNHITVSELIREAISHFLGNETPSIEKLQKKIDSMQSYIDSLEITPLDYQIPKKAESGGNA